MSINESSSDFSFIHTECCESTAKFESIIDGVTLQIHISKRKKTLKNIEIKSIHVCCLQAAAHTKINATYVPNK